MMNALYQFFYVNYNIVIFVYGFIFFLMGFGILLKSRQHSKFSLAKSLHWLALFGILHAFADWGHMFIPIQKAYASEQIYVILRTLRIILNTVSFTFLLQFGISLLVHTKNRWHKSRYLPVILFFLWFAQLIFYKMFLDIEGDELWWVRVSDIWSRYIMALPGALISGYAIFLQKNEFIKYGHRSFVGTLTLTSFSMVIYGISAGIFVPPGPVNFAILINSELFFEMTGLPIEIMRAASGLFMAFSILKIIKVFDKEYINRIQKSEKEKVIYEERNRIAQDLHDGIIQSLYATNLQMEVINHLIEKNPEMASEKLSVCLSRRSQIINQIREYIGELKREPDPNQSLKERIVEIIDELNVKEKVKVKLEYYYFGDLSVKILYNLTLIIKEAVSNVLKHAEAKHLLMTVDKINNRLKIKIIDDGKGFIVEQQNSSTTLGNKQGLINIMERVNTLDGKVEIKSLINKGTTIIIEIPLEGD